MYKKLFALVAISLASLSAYAGIMDFFNGVTVGKPLPAHDLKYLGAAPDPAAKLQLIDFWATWCAPCRESIPKLNTWNKQYAPRGLAVIGVTREGVEVVQPFMKKVVIEYPIGLEQKLVLHDALKIKGLPYAIFVSSAGKIVWRGPPGEINEQLIESLLLE